MTAYSALQTLVSRDLADPDRQTFDVDTVKDFIQQGLAAVARVSPYQFQEDITPTPDQTVYPLLSLLFPVEVPEARVVRVEVWTGTPAYFLYKIKAKAGQPTRDSIAGWEVWNGQLEIPGYIAAQLTTDHLLRIWGYSPYPPISADGDVVPVSAELELAVRKYARMESLRKLTQSRVLFKQWQVRSNNTDVTVGQLMSDLQVAEEEWRKLARELKVPEQNPD